MMEYIFFKTAFPALRRIRPGARHPLQERQDKMGLIVAVPEDLDDALANRLETYYAMLMDDQAELVEDSRARPEAQHRHQHHPCRRPALHDRIEPAMMGRLMVASASTKSSSSPPPSPAAWKIRTTSPCAIPERLS